MTFIETLTLIKDVMSEYVWSWPANWWPNTIPLLVLVLLGTGIFVSFRYGFIQFRRFAHGWKVIRGDYDNPDDAGDINHFQALSAAIGIGNIAGIATAIHYGGPGDVAIGLMAFPNLIAIILLSGKVKEMLDDYMSRKHEPYAKRQDS